MKFDFFADNKQFKSLFQDIVETFGIKDFTYNFLLKFYQNNAIKNTKKILKNSKDIPEGKGKKIVFNVLNGIYGSGTFLTAGLSIALKKRGYNPMIITCGGALNMCTAGIHINSPQSPCKNCIEYAKQFYSILNISHKTYFDYISKKEIKESKQKQIDIYKGVDIKTLSTNSATRYFKGKISKKKYNEIYNEEIKNSITAIDVAEKFVEKEKPDIIISNHLQYSAWGGFSKYCENKGVIIRDIMGGMRRNSMCSLPQSFSDYLKIRNNQMLDNEESVELFFYFNKRMLGQIGDTAWYNFNQNIEEIKNINFKDYKRVFAMFTNVSYDTGLLEVKRDFEDIYDWVSYTVDLFRNKPEYLLIIKVHPAEVVFKSEGTLYDFLKELNLPENIKVIPSETELSAYNLFNYIDIGIVYSGTLGLEMTLKGIPVIVGSNPHYANNRFTFDAKTKEEYEQLLFGEIPKLSKKQIELASLYAYYFFIKSYVPLNFMFFNNFLDVGWNIKSFDELNPGKDKHLDIICDYIIKGGVYQHWK